MRDCNIPSPSNPASTVSVTTRDTLEEKEWGKRKKKKSVLKSFCTDATLRRLALSASTYDSLTSVR
jgi:hypothetical protein